jgi:hypothetical protein
VFNAPTTTSFRSATLQYPTTIPWDTTRRSNFGVRCGVGHSLLRQADKKLNRSSRIQDRRIITIDNSSGCLENCLLDPSECSGFDLLFRVPAASTSFTASVNLHEKDPSSTDRGLSDYEAASLHNHPVDENQF